MRYAAQYGVTAESLMGFDSPQGMEAAAKGQAGQSKEIRDLTAKVDALTKAQVPPSSLASANTAGAEVSQNRDARLMYLATKQGDWTDAEMVEYTKLTSGA